MILYGAIRKMHGQAENLCPKHEKSFLGFFGGVGGRTLEDSILVGVSAY